MSSSQRVSAFAKRRRLNDGTPTPASDSDILGSCHQPKNPKVKRITINTPSSDVAASHDTKFEPKIPGNLGDFVDENNFEALVDADIVKFSGTREIEQLDDTSYKIRLSRGQTCSVLGISCLWVREGTVTVYDAEISQATDLYPLFAHETDGPAVIEAQTKFAEIQLESISISDLEMSSTLNLPGKLGNNARHSPLTFQILGQGTDTEYSDKLNSRAEASEPRAKDTAGNAQRLLICGKRSAATSTSSIRLINHYLSVNKRKGNRGVDNSVALLDLDARSPMFGPPGTISVTIIRNFILGPSYTHPLQETHLPHDRLVASHFLGTSLDDNSSSPTRSIVKKLLRADKSIGTLPLVVRIGAWMVLSSLKDLAELCKLALLEAVLCVDGSKSSAFYEVALMLTKNESLRFIHAPLQVSTTSSALLHHRLTLQSQFRFHRYAGMMPLWHPRAARSLVERKLVLQLGIEPGNLNFVTIRGGSINPLDLFEALNEVMVSVIAIRIAPGVPLLNAYSSLIRDISDSDDQYPLGLAYVVLADEKAKKITLNTCAEGAQLEKCWSDGYAIGLVLERPGTDGWFGRHLLAE